MVGPLIYSNTFNEGSFKDSLTILELANKYNKVIMIGAQTASSSSGSTTYYEEGKGYMFQQMSEITRMLTEYDYDNSTHKVKKQGKELFNMEIAPFDRFGFIYHQLESYLVLKD